MDDRELSQRLTNIENKIDTLTQDINELLTTPEENQEEGQEEETETPKPEKTNTIKIKRKRDEEE